VLTGGDGRRRGEARGAVREAGARRAGVRLAEPGELTLITLPLLSNAKLCGALIVDGSVSVAGWIDQSLASSSAMNPSLNSAPGASSVRKRKLSSAQLTPAGTVRLTRRLVRSLTPARGPGLGSMLPFSSVSAPAGSTCSVSPDDRTANVVPSCGKSENGLSATAAGLPAGASCANDELATALDALADAIAVVRSEAVRVGVTAAPAVAGRAKQASPQTSAAIRRIRRS